MQNKTRTQEIFALGHLVIQNSSGPVNDRRFYSNLDELSNVQTEPILTYLVNFSCNLGAYNDQIWLSRG